MKLKLPSFKTRPYHVIVVMVGLLAIISVYAAFSIANRFWATLFLHLIGFLILFIFSRYSYKRLTRFAPSALPLSLLLLLWTFIFGSGAGGRSVQVLGIQFQTFYLITILVIFFLCVFIASHTKNEREMEKNEIIFAFVILIFFAGIIAIRNFSTTLLLLGTGLLILFVAGISKKIMARFIILGLLAVSLYIGIGMLHNSQSSASDNAQVASRSATVASRIKYYFTGESDTKHYGKQTLLSKTAVARSTNFSIGPGKGLVKHNMAEGENDYVFSLISEELTIVGSVLIILIYLAIFLQSIRISVNSKGNFARLFSFAIGVLITMQAFIHIGVNVGGIPATGQTLPFISRGMTTLLASYAIIGILINIAKNSSDADEEIK